MGIKIENIINHLESIAPLVYQESYDNAGLLTGSAEMETDSVLVSLDCTEEVVDDAIDKGCKLIISHHPIIFNGLKKINGKNDIERTIIKAIKNDIAIYAIHTNLDNVHLGVNKRLAEIIGLKHTRVLLPKNQILKKLVTFIPVDHLSKVKDALFDAGAGNIGNYDQCSFAVEGIGTFRGNEQSNPFVGTKGKEHHEKEVKLEMIFPKHFQQNIIAALIRNHPYEEVAFDIISLDNFDDRIGAGMIGELNIPLSPIDFLGHLKQAMGLKSIRYTETNQAKIKTVAICGGAGSFLLKTALAQKADAFVTGDFKYHEFFDADKRLMIADVGHYESEFFTKELLRDLILEKFPTFAVLLTQINTNPIKYF
jgi:dinuclear metal center YbgI/SA1388 family protein